MTWNQMRIQMRLGTAALMAVAVLGTYGAAHAQDLDMGGSVGAEGQADPETGYSGATWEESSGTPEASDQSYSSPSSSSDPRIGLQVRFDAVNVLGLGDMWGRQDIGGLSVPIVTPGVRLLDSRLYLGLGFGFTGYSIEQPGPPSTEESRSAFSFSPLVMFDVLSDKHAALSLGGWLNLVPVGDTEVCVDPGGCQEGNDGGLGWGLDLVVGLRGKISPGLAVGGEFGWGFLMQSAGDTDIFGHGVVGTILLEASVGV